MLNKIIQVLLMVLIVFTPIAFGSVELWAFSLMELGILLIIILWAIQKLITPNSELRTPNLKLKTYNSTLLIYLLSFFLLLILFQMVPLPAEIVKFLSPKTYALRLELSPSHFAPTDPSRLTPDASPFSTSSFPLSFVPFLTKIEFFKWLTLAALFIFLLFWKPFKQPDRTRDHLIVVVMLVGVGESLYGMYEFFSGHQHILHLRMDHLISSVTGTFLNRNAFSGYLLMAIPLSLGYLFSRKSYQMGRSMGWRHRLASLDGKTLSIAFGIVVMIIGLLFSASRMGIASLLLSFTLISLFFMDPERGHRFSKTTILIFCLAMFWAAWIGLDAVISRFFTASESFKERWAFWLNTLQIVRDYPLFGSGLGTFAQVFPIYRTLHIRGLVTHAENDFFQLASEVGVLGIGALGILFVYLSYKTLFKMRSLSRRDPQRYIGTGGMIGILALMFHSLVERNIQIPANAFLYTFIWAIVLRIGLVKKGDL